MHRFAFIVLLSLIVSACAGGPSSTYGPGGYGGASQQRPPVVVGPAGDVPPSPLARSATYTCEELTTVVLTEGQATAQATLNSGLVLSLARQPGGGGLRYGAPPYEFIARGGEATFYNNGRPAHCRAK